MEYMHTMKSALAGGRRFCDHAATRPRPPGAYRGRSIDNDTSGNLR